MSPMENINAINFLQREEPGCTYSVIFKGQETKESPSVLIALQRAIPTRGDEMELRKACITTEDFVKLISRDEFYQIAEAAEVSRDAAVNVLMDVIEANNQQVIVNACYQAMQSQPEAFSWSIADGKLEIRKHDNRMEKVKQLVTELFPDYSEVQITLKNRERRSIYNRD